MSARSHNTAPSSNQQQQYRNSDVGSTGFGTAPINSNSENQPQNIMHDRRVIRGSTCSLRRSIENRLNTMSYQSSTNSSKQSTNRRRVKRRKNDSYKKYKSKNMNDGTNTKTPRPISGRLNAEIQTDPYLEKLYVHKNETDFGTQTDPLLDRPSKPLFVPKLSGKCMATQIEDGDLFDFDREIEPILEVLIGKTIENALMEVLEEQELKAFQNYKSEFEQKRNVELVKCQRLEEEQRRKNEEKQRRIEQSEIQKRKEKELKERINAQRIATEFLENIENAVFDELNNSGYFYDPIIREIETEFMPALIENVESKIDNVRVSNLIIDDIIAHFVENMMDTSRQIIGERDEKQREFENQQMFEKKLNEKFTEMRTEFTQAIKSQKNDFDFKEQIIQFLDIPICAPITEESVADEANKEEKAEIEEDTQELPSEIEQNIEYINGLMEQFADEEEPLWKQISSMFDKVGGEVCNKIKRIEQYLETFSIKLHKKQLLDTFVICKEDDEKLKKAILDCLEMETFDEQAHNTLFESLKSDEEKEQMNAINELLKDKEDIKQFIVAFTKKKEEERIAEETAKAEEEAADAENEEES